MLIETWISDQLWGWLVCKNSLGRSFSLCISGNKLFPTSTRNTYTFLYTDNSYLKFYTLLYFGCSGITDMQRDMINTSCTEHLVQKFLFLFIHFFYSCQHDVKMIWYYNSHCFVPVTTLVALGGKGPPAKHGHV